MSIENNFKVAYESIKNKTEIRCTAFVGCEFIFHYDGFWIDDRGEKYNPNFLNGIWSECHLKRRPNEMWRAKAYKIRDFPEIHVGEFWYEEKERFYIDIAREENIEFVLWEMVEMDLELTSTYGMSERCIDSKIDTKKSKEHSLRLFNTVRI